MYREKKNDRGPKCAFRDCGLFQGLCFDARNDSHIANLAVSLETGAPVDSFVFFVLFWMRFFSCFVIFTRLVCMYAALRLSSRPRNWTRNKINKKNKFAHNRESRTRFHVSSNSFLKTAYINILHHQIFGVAAVRSSSPPCLLMRIYSVRRRQSIAGDSYIVAFWFICSLASRPVSAQKKTKPHLRSVVSFIRIVRCCCLSLL